MTFSLRDIPIGYRQGLSILSIVSLMIGVAALAITGSREPRAKLAELIDESNALQFTVAQMRQDLLQQEALSRTMAGVTSFDESKSTIAALKSAHASYQEQLQHLADPKMLGPSSPFVTDLRELQRSVVPGLAEASANVEAFNPVKAMEALGRQVSPANVESLRTLDQLLLSRSHALQARVEALDSAARKTDLAIMAISAAAVLIALAIAVVLTRSITRPLRQAVQYANELGEGHLDANKPLSSHDEAGALISALGNMADRIAEMHHRLEKLSTEDALTGAANRRQFDYVINLEHGRAARLAAKTGVTESAQMALLMLDVDHFKKYNDKFGHQAGDECLKKVVLAVRAAGLRPSDVVARYGGEEFAVILPSCNLEGATAVAERIRGMIERAGIESAGPDSPVVTVSVGAAVATNPARTSVAALIREADAQLYKSKRDGRNRVSIAPAPEECESQTDRESVACVS
ncbi:sensor domain-containing diguanylate cyclase [Piscinibacter sp. HJYY11]|uniref:sensor domain-containing diguanylate cyclase n=1 Tax=Piscinibacter sp. HJYY11 TaxID=2801333 RepID=UPI00191CCB36|nr:sensor domain-containing diguanylate cyclase [Piscinibacter sp. HJYY11]MBL0729611.1 sensor domain-containing diguanylate cyclase [Piscinibacter sp. HJYY11]